MGNNNLKLISINDLLGMKFHIPTYQRGYRWQEQQVIDLLNDILEFKENKSRTQEEIYCIQPLVVKFRDKVTLDSIKEANSIDEVKSILKGSWDVIDGQQRLTTIHILLSYLEPKLPNKYSIEYATHRNDCNDDNIPGSKELLDSLHEEAFRNSDDYGKIKDSNIDYFHICQTYQVVSKWFDEHKVDKAGFLSVLKSKVQFIWYETEEADPIRVFTRLNIGKIALTDSELIKALFLNKANFGDTNSESVRLQQIEVASEWDKIEYALQNEEFWLFLHEVGWSKPTRIDFIFDLIREKKDYGAYDKLGHDEHKTFRYFYEHFKNNKSEIDAEWIRKTWKKVKTYYQIFEEWYNNLEFYHYVGFLIHHGEKLDKLIELYKNDKNSFKGKLIELIKTKLKNCSDLERVYGEDGEKKTECRPLLILFNIQSVINENLELIKDEKYKLGTFYKFPFHLFKKEGKKKNGKGWEVEHIASNSGDNLDNEKNQKAWLASVAYCLPPTSELKVNINDFITQNKGDFKSLVEEITKLDINPLTGIDKQKVWNYALLDSSTNEEYHNDPFPIKRICLLSKEQGHKAKVTFNEKSGTIEIDKSESAIAFVPPCTKNVFIKAYTDLPDSLSAWTEKDAMAYKAKIEEVLHDFLS